MKEKYIGLMSGTSMDAIDCVLVEFSAATPHVLAASQTPINEDIRIQLLALCQGTDSELDKLAALDNRLGHLFAQEILKLLESTGTDPETVSAIGSHGQTIRHYPPGTTLANNSIQIGDPNLIAGLTDITTVADFRRRDMAVGGQGAPLVPAFHNEVFRSTAKNRVILNIGGIANITILPRDADKKVSGFDTGPGNVLMDAWVALHLEATMDSDGAWGASGTINRPLLAKLLDDAYFTNPPPKSTGREYFNMGWLNPLLADHASTAADIQATLCELTAISISDAIENYAPQTDEILICGGGIHNKHLLDRLKDSAFCAIHHGPRH